MSWNKQQNSQKRQLVYNKFLETVIRYPWNDQDRVNSGLSMLAVVHATSEKIAWKVADKGFVAISKLDEGFYGKGIYFTSYALYALPYIYRVTDPAFILTYVLPGDPYPIIESISSPDNYVGKGLKGSSISHYVVTNNKGGIASQKQEKYDELVFAQESALLPAFILIPDKSNLGELVKHFLRALPGEDTDRDKKRKKKNDENRDEKSQDTRIDIIDDIIERSDITDDTRKFVISDDEGLDKKRDKKSDKKRDKKSKKKIDENSDDDPSYHDYSSSSSSDERKLSILDVEYS